MEATGGEAEALLKAAWISSTSSARIEELKTKTLKFLTSHPFIKMQRSATHLLQGVLRRQMAQRISAVLEGNENAILRARPILRAVFVQLLQHPSRMIHDNRLKPEAL